jgi:hypothetical protein
VESVVLDSPVEEVKAPDLSELLEKSEANPDNVESNETRNEKEEEDFTVDLSEIENTES